MTRFVAQIRLILLVAWLLGGAATALAAVAPQIKPLGQIRDGFVAPTRLDVDAQGNLYVVDARKKAVFKFDKYGNKSKGIQSFTAAAASGGGLAVSDDGARLFVAEAQSVAVLDGATGALLGYLGGQNRFGHVYDIDIDAKGYVFVADAGRLKIEVYRPGGQGPVPYVFDYQFGAKGVAVGQFMGIAAMEIHAAAGEVYVADPNYYKPEGSSTVVSYPKVQVYDLAGNLKKVTGGTANFILLGSKSFGVKEMIYFGGMTFDGQGRGYFTDSYNGRINVLNVGASDPLKMYLSSYAVVGYKPGQLSDPRDAAFDPLTGRLFVLCGDGRVEVFGIDGATSPVKVNQPPEVPVPASPVGRGEVSSATPRLSWQTAQDPDGDPVVYRVKIGEEGAETKVYDSGAATTLTLPDSLRENAPYVWAVQAFDGEDASEWSAPQAFYVNAVEEAPVPPVPGAPEVGAVVDGLTVFSWQIASDPDPFEVLSYVVQVAADAGFSAPILEEAVAGTGITLGDCADYLALTDGQGYFWRVKAIDSTGLESPASEPLAFTYDSTILQVTANVSGARVYIAGNLGFSGQLIGEAPVALRDFPVGFCSIVVENAGFEPTVAQVEVVDRVGALVQLKLIPALTPVKFVEDVPVRAGLAPLRVGAEAAPFWADYDNDGWSDLLVGSAAGSLQLYRGQSEDGSRYAEGETLALSTLVPGAVPVLADWNNDLRKDLLVGGADGTVTLFLNNGDEQAPVFAEGALLAGPDGVLDVGDGAKPVVVDLDDDGQKDLLLGSANGVIAWYRNVGVDGNPELAFSANLIAPPAATPAAPFVTDWNSDGRRDLLIIMGGRIHGFLRQANGAFGPAMPIAIANRTGGEMLQHLFAADISAGKGKDLLAGSVDGQVRLLKGAGKVVAPAFAQFMLARIAKLVENLGDDQRLIGSLAGVQTALRMNNYRAASEKMEMLYKKVSASNKYHGQIKELRDLLLLAVATGT